MPWCYCEKDGISHFSFEPLQLKNCKKDGNTCEHIHFKGKGGARTIIIQNRPDKNHTNKNHTNKNYINKNNTDMNNTDINNTDINNTDINNTDINNTNKKYTD